MTILVAPAGLGLDDALMTRRVREVVGVGVRPCGLCGSADVVLVRSHNQGNLLERALLRVERDERTTATCRSCGSRTPVPVRPPAVRVQPVERRRQGV